MTLLPNWRRVWWRLWSVRIMLATVLNGLAMGIFAFVDVLPPWEFLALSVALPAAGIAVRMIKQPRLDDETRP